MLFRSDLIAAGILMPTLPDLSPENFEIVETNDALNCAGESVGGCRISELVVISSVMYIKTTIVCYIYQSVFTKEISGYEHSFPQ